MAFGYNFLRAAKSLITSVEDGGPELSPRIPNARAWSTPSMTTIESGVNSMLRETRNERKREMCEQEEGGGGEIGEREREERES